MDKRSTRQADWRISMLGDASGDARALEAELARRIAGEVRFDAGTKALYATDASNYRFVPTGVVIPKTVDDVVAAIAIARRHGVPVTGRGGATSLAGQTTNAALIIDYSKYLNQIVELDIRNRRARVQPGLILDDLRDAAERHHLTFGPDPATHNRCTIGGMIANDACGVHAQMAGCADDNVLELEVLTYDGARFRVGPTSEADFDRIIAEGGRRGEIYARIRALRDRHADLIRARIPDIPRNVSGYGLQYLLPEHGCNLAAALVGSEGTLATFLEATVKLVYSYPGRALVVLGYPDVFAAGDHVEEIVKHEPIGLEGMDECLVRYMERKGLHAEDLGFLPDGRGWLIVEMGGRDEAEAEAKARALIDWLEKQPDAPNCKLYTDPGEQEKLWTVRESGLGATAFVPGEPDTWPGWEDSAVPTERVGDYLRDLRALLERHGYGASLYGHFGQGCIHCRINFDLASTPGIEKYRAFVEEATDLVARYGGSISGEHGDGQARGELLIRLFGPELVEVFREFKAIWDPENGMNPGKVVDAYPLDSHLRLGPTYAPPEVETYFSYPEDEGDFARATLRCVGVGECRRLEGGTMCPSFMVTREEQHTTRGRANALFEMLRGEVLEGGWQDEHVHDALHLCLSCKGCKSDCPVNVDMATYKAEFLAHYHERKPRERVAFAMGFVNYWAGLASRVPHLANWVTRTPALAAVAKRVAGIAPERELPAFAPETFRAWFARRAPGNVGARRVILWADTFNNHFHPNVAKAAVEVLEAAGFRVELPERALCCGRPLYDFGFLNQAKAWLGDILAALRNEIRAGVPVVGLEPSCVSVFRDELMSFFPHDEDAKRLSHQIFMLGEFLDAHAPDFEPPRLERDALVHMHCHHKAVLEIPSEKRMLEKLGLDFEVLDSGCCGMAGSFGFEPGDKYETSVAAGERVLLPAVREAGPDALVVTDGFSCHEQIAQGAGREALHLAEVIQLALRGGSRSASEPAEGLTRTEKALAAGAGALALGVASWMLTRRRA